VGIPLTVSLTFAVPPVRTVILVCEAEICGAVEEAEMYAITDTVAEPAALLALHAIVVSPPAGTLFGAV
jgi:hypothetical protein